MDISNIGERIISRLAEGDLFLYTFQVQAGLLGVILIFLGFVQNTISNFKRETNTNLGLLADYWSSKYIINNVRMLIVISTMGSIISMIGYIFPNSLLGLISFILLLLVLIGLASLSLRTAKLVLYTGAQIDDN